MILHKIFHLNHSVEEAQQRLADVASYRDQLDGVERLDFTGHGISHWRLRLPMGLQAKMVISDLGAETPNTAVFKTLDGNVEVFGVVTFHVIRPNLTEVDVQLNYEFRSPVARALDAMLGLGDAFLVRQLRGVRAHFEGKAPATLREDSPAFPGMALKAA